MEMNKVHTCTYTNKKGTTKKRTFIPLEQRVNKSGEPYIKALDEYRNEVISLSNNSMQSLTVI